MLIFDCDTAVLADASLGHLGGNTQSANRQQVSTLLMPASWNRLSGRQYSCRNQSAMFDRLKNTKLGQSVRVASCEMAQNMQFTPMQLLKKD